MLSVRKEFCAGCGSCIRVCPTGAISLDAGTARIDQDKCTACYNCIQVCPKGAIGAAVTGSEPAPASSMPELRNSILRLQAELQTTARRLKNLEQRSKR